ncbi:ribokinase [Luteimonas sp. RD2P54]|uniref:Ribokinase n=1 Tax=Luteimonas endophytica TaxID=3042023 RepID=A0ABT6J814_9GAMM|nr:ribokinase [Luteimonas endophytica]MDH5822960.1 ribokinase [Luteimonas endophytica]
MPRVLVAGSFNVDHVWTAARLPRPGETLAGRYATGPGGKGFNQAVAARRAGADTSFLCALGADAGGELARALARTDGIDLREAPSAAPTGTAGIYLDEAGNNSIVIGAGANAHLSAEFVTAQADAFADAAVVLVQLESPAPAILAALRRARAAGSLAMLNPAPANAEVGAELLASSDIVTPNETEFAGLLERRVGRAPPDAGAGTLPDAQLHALCRELLPHGTVVLTLGGAGCFVSHAEDRRRGDEAACYRAAAAPARVVDTTGAGDAFNGALAASLALRPEAPFTTHVGFATRYAGASTEREGAAAAMPHLAP